MGAPLTSRDVKWTFDSLLGGKIRSTKSAAYRLVDRVEAPDDLTVIFHLKEPFATLLWNLSDGAIGIVPSGSLSEISDHPIGSGPFRFVSAEPDKEVVLERNDEYWGQKARLERVRFAIVPDMTTRALELRKGTADIAINSLTPDMVVTLQKEPTLSVLRGPGTVLQYMGFNYRDPILKDVRVRQALAYAIDRRPMLEYLWRGFAQPAASILPPQSWAYSADVRELQLRSRTRAPVARLRRLPSYRGRPLSSDDENFDGRKHALDGGGVATAIAAGSDSVWTFAPLNLAHFSPTSAAEHSSFIPCAGSVEMKIPTFSNTLFTPASSPPMAQTAASTPIPKLTD